MPYFHGTDLKFEHLNHEDVKNAVEDLKKGISITSPFGISVKMDDLTEGQKKTMGDWQKINPSSIRYKYNQETHSIEKIAQASMVVASFLKLAGYDRDKLVSGYKGRFVIHDHAAEKAGKHFDLRLEFPVTSLHRALSSYEGKRLPGTEEPMEKYPDKPGTVYRSFAVRKHTLPTGDKKLFIVETEDHPVSYGTFKGIISEGYGAGKVDIFDKGTFELLNVEGDKKYTIDFHGKKLNGIYALVKYNRGYLWVKTKDQSKKADFNWNQCSEAELDFAAALGLGPKYIPQPRQTVECPSCHNQNAYYREEHPDTDMNEIVLFCPDCHNASSKRASAIDYVRPTMPSDVWDLSLNPPKLKESVRKKLLEILHHSLSQAGFSEKWIENIFISGSSTSWNSQENGDLDVDVQYDPVKLEKLCGDLKRSLNNIQAVLDKNRDLVIAPNSQRTYSFMLLPEDDFPGSDGVYDVLKNTWVKGPIEIPQGFDPDKTFARQKEKAVSIVKTIQSIIVDIEVALTQLSKIDQFVKRNVEKYSEMAGKRVMLLSQVKDSCDLLVAWRKYIWFLHDESKNIQTAVYPAFNFSTDWSENYIVFKYVARFGGHEPVQSLYHQIQDSPYFEMIKKFMPENAVGRFYK
jgi:hypothetical protein